jgi:hypothetical protein
VKSASIYIYVPGMIIVVDVFVNCVCDYSSARNNLDKIGKSVSFSAIMPKLPCA